MKEKKRNIILSETPSYITIGAHYKCNADCIFCLGGDYPDFSLEFYKSFFEKKLLDVMRAADHVGFCGMGEVLLMPKLLEFLDYVNRESLPDVTKVFTTNGTPLKAAVREKLTDGKYSLIISLHASEPELHDFLLGKKSFDLIIENIKELVALKKKKNSNLHINLVFLMTRHNMDNLPDFIRFASEIGAERVTCGHITIFNIDQLKLSCFLEQDKTNRILDEARKVAEEVSMDISLPLYFGEKDDSPQICDDPWNFFYTEVQGSVNPCCNAGNHIGYLNEDSFEDIWNGEGYIRLRRGFIEEKPYKWCRYCARYKKSNINDIRSHVTFRPETRKEIMDYLEKNTDIPLPKNE
ncbi:MAG: hypothetical protein GX817_05560 [Elusimicrobia bacterium]|nr:hypothetical protein [Elusimicrobiota bacterium]